VLQQRGVAAWLCAWQTSVPAAPLPPPAQPAVELPPGAEQLVAVLATMALACIGS